MDPDFDEVAVLVVPVTVVPVDLAGGVFWDNDFIDFFCDIDFFWISLILF